MILVAGSANLDFVIRTPRIPAPGETVLGREFRTFPGGKGANQAVACARAGAAATEMLLALGDDPFAAPIEASLAAAGVRTHVVRPPGVPTGTAFISVSDAGENAIAVAPGANGSLRPGDLPPLDGCTHLLMQLETPVESVTAWARAARTAGVTVVLNAAPARPLATELLALLDVLVVNRAELAAIAGADGEVDECLGRVGVPWVVATLGARGCRARCGRERVGHDGFAVAAVDTTAAGDTFCGVLVAELSRAAPAPDALRRANAAAALACTQAGAQSSIPTRAAIDTFLRRAG